ncbi:MAG: AAA family ATPase [Oscillospiraceae bacterium]|nr:AAA family ATPase [Oscillospiraceae bacterium]
MIIKKANAVFGRLDEETLSFTPGLNIITLPNESGKSTWCAFIRAMLFGLDSPRRGRSGEIAPKLRYSPFSGKSPCGEMDIVWQGREITISRESVPGDSTPLKSFSAVYSGTNVSCNELSGIDAGEKLTGCNRKVYDDIVTAVGEKMLIEGGAELDKLSESRISSGEDSSDGYIAAEKRLGEFRRKLKYNQTGLIPTGLKKLEALRLELEKTSAAELQLMELNRQLSAIDGKSEEEAAEERNRLEEIGLMAAQLKKNSENEEIELRLSELKEKKSSLTSELEKEKARPHGNSVKSKAGLRKHFCIILTVLAAVFLFAAFLTEGKNSFIFFELAVISLVFALIFLYKMLKASYSASSGEIPVSEEEAALQRRLNDINSEISELLSRRSEEESEALQKYSGTLDLAQRALYSQNEIAELKTKKARLEGESGFMKSSSEIRAEIKELEELIQHYEFEYEAAELAEKALLKASEQTAGEFLPKISALAEQYLDFLTDGKYDKLLLDKDYSSSAGKEGESKTAFGFLSQGTKDQITLAIKLALNMTLLPDDKACPIILDDALASFDDDRLFNAVKLLSGLSEKRQIILFSCTRREAEALKALKAVSTEAL